MSTRHLPAESQDDRVVFDAQTPTPLMSRGLDYLAEKESTATTSPGDPTLLWSYESKPELDWLLYSAVKEDTVYIANETELMALEANSGLERLRVTLPNWFDEERPLVISQPKVVYAVTTDGMHALNAADGEEIWFWHERPVWTAIRGLFYLLAADRSFRALDPQSGAQRWWTWQWHNLAPGGVDVDGDRVYIASGTHGFSLNFIDNPEFVRAVTDDHSLRALSADSGQELWFKRVAGGNRAPVVRAGRGQLFARVVANSISALDGLAGTELWRFHSSVELTPILVTDDTLFVKGQDEIVHALDTSAGTERWRFLPSAEHVSLKRVAENTVYLEEAGSTLWAIDATTGNPRWSVPGLGAEWEWLVEVHEGVVLLGASYLKSHSYDEPSGDDDICLRAIDSRTGLTLWTIYLFEPIQSISAMMNVLFVVTTKEVYCLQGLETPPDNKHPVRPTRWTLLDSETARLLGRDTGPGLFRQTGTP